MVIESIDANCVLFKRRKRRKEEKVQIAVDVNWENSAGALFHISAKYKNTKIQMTKVQIALGVNWEYSIGALFHPFPAL